METGLRRCCLCPIAVCRGWTRRATGRASVPGAVQTRTNARAVARRPSASCFHCERATAWVWCERLGSWPSSSPARSSPPSAPFSSTHLRPADSPLRAATTPSPAHSSGQSHLVKVPNYTEAHYLTGNNAINPAWPHNLQTTASLLN